MTVTVRKLDAPTVREASADGYAPLVRCDECGKEIKKPAGGRVAWDPDENRTYLSVALLHGDCVGDHRAGRSAGVRTADLTHFVESLGRFLRG